ncbi:MAG: hypothetical protein IJ386_07215 [Clostridia bacterium]|nr:hypothetical protein [Clostridia bacterium]
METTLKDLWHDYALEKYITIGSGREKELLTLIVKAEEELRTTLSPRQTELLEEIIEHLHDMSSLFSETAFTAGIRFATSYLLEALGNDENP